MGWEHKGSLWFTNKLNKYKLRKWKENELDIWFSHGTINHMGEEETELRFRGIIKNKSELKRLMQQLKINLSDNQVVEK